MLFEIVDGGVNEIREQIFCSEKELQKLCEDNLQQLLNLDFVDTEFAVADFRLDTVAFDRTANSFVIIEYKNQRNTSVIDQGYTYLSTMFNHKANFVLRYNIKYNTAKDIDDFDWSQSKVIFISPTFTKYQTNSINFKDLPIELWKIKKYKNDTLLFEQIKSVSSNESIRSVAPILNSASEQDVAREMVTYSEDELTEKAEDYIVDIYNELKDYILGLDDNIAIKPTKIYIGFNRGRKSVISVKLQKKSIILWINAEPNQINDPQGIVKDVTNIGHHGNGHCQIKLSDDHNIGYIQDLLKTYIESIK